MIIRTGCADRGRDMGSGYGADRGGDVDSGYCADRGRKSDGRPDHELWK